MYTCPLLCSVSKITRCVNIIENIGASLHREGSTLVTIQPPSAAAASKPIYSSTVAVFMQSFVQF